MGIRIKLVDGRTYRLDGIDAERVSRQLDNESESIEFSLEGVKTRIYKRYIVSVVWRGIEND